MEKQVFQEIPLADISPNPWNPRRRFSGPRFDELVASVRSKGVLEPVLLRPLPDGGKLVGEKKWPNYATLVHFEIVAGERRFRAAYKVAEENSGADHATIPAMVRELSDDDAFDVMTIENLQREDLSELEEAESFKLYLDRRGDDALQELAERTGINSRYIRRRVAVLNLPKKVLKAWGKGELKYGHLEQFLRLKDKKEIMEFAEKAIDYIHPVAEIRRQIDSRSPALKDALFDAKKDCASCIQNSDVQKELFGEFAAMDQTRCLEPKCFKQKQNNHLIKSWEKSELRKKYKTNGFRFRGDISYNAYNTFWKMPKKACRECPNFVTLIDLAGTVTGNYYGRVCIGDNRCFVEKTRSPEKKTGKSSKPAKGPRVPWHGEYFREEFLKDEIPLKFKEVPPDDVKAMHLALYSLLRSNDDLRHKFCEAHELEWFTEKRKVFSLIAKMDREKVMAELKEASLQVLMQGMRDGAWRAGAKARMLFAEHVGIDLETEWRISEEYLRKKTKAEILALGEELGIFADKKAQTYLYETLLKKRGAFKSCKKGELIQVFLESGVDLAGKVPAEILAAWDYEQPDG